MASQMDAGAALLSGSELPYAAKLSARFHDYRSTHFAGKNCLFEVRPPGGAIVFRPEHRAENIPIPPFADAHQRQEIVGLIPVQQRHRHFGSMGSSQALAQSVFGTIQVMGRTPLLNGVKAECGRPAFGSGTTSSSFELERSVRSLGEPRPTSIDVWLPGPDPVAIECKYSEAKFGTCSRMGLRPHDKAYQAQYCDGTHTHQRGRAARCSLTEIGVRYWDYAEALFGWAPDEDHTPCPMAFPYQLVRNILAASIGADGRLSLDRGHALVLYDEGNPAMASGGAGDLQWIEVMSALKMKEKLRRISWQSLIAQWPKDDVFCWLHRALDEKYGLTH